MFKTTCWLLLLCALSVRAERATGPKPNASENVKITPQNISAPYIGDLLRTKPRVDLEEAGSAQQPVRVIRHHARPSPHRSFDDDRRHPESHQYARSQDGRSYIPVDAKTSVPVTGRFLSLRPVRYVHHEAQRGARDSQTPQPYRKAPHYEGDDCPKGEDHSYEGRQYDRQHRREKQFASVEGGYEEDDRSVEHSSYAVPHRSTYASNSHPSNTKSQSNSGSSHSNSKSTSTSKTMTPKRVKQSFTIVPKKFSETDYEKPTIPEQDAQGRDFVDYKTGDPRVRPGQGHGSYPPPKEYGAGYETEATPFSQYPPEASGHRKGSTRVQTPYSNDATRERPQQYPPYESDRGSYEQSTYAPGRQYQPTESYQRGREYTTRSIVQEPTQYGAAQYQNYQDSEPGHRYESPGKSQRPFENRHFATTPSGERVSYGKEMTHKSTLPSRPLVYSNDQHSHVPDHKPQNYPSYSHQGATPDYAGSSLHGGHQIVSPNEEEDVLLDTTHHRSSKSRHLKSHKKQHHEPRYARSSGLYSAKPTGSAEERSVLPVNGPSAAVGRDGKPYVSHSVSYSNSGDGANEEPQLKPGPVEGRQKMPFYAEQPVTYKPFNSEYPASYANDPLHRSGARQNRHYSPRSYERPDSDEDDHRRPYDDGSGSYEQQDAEGDPDPKDKSGHNYVSNIEGYRDEYHSDVPLHLDDAFFKKYGISKKAKIIVASAVDPHLLVADGSKVAEGGYKDEEGGPYEDGYTASEEEDDRRYADSLGDPNQGPGYQHNNEEEDQDSPEEHGPKDSPGSFEHAGFGPKDSPGSFEHVGFGPKDLPGSFDDLVDTNAKFLKNLPSIMNPGDSAFKSDVAFDENDFHNVAHKGFVVSQGPREIVQQHGDGVSRILFNVPRKEDDPFKMAEDEALLSAASALLEEIVKSDS